MSEYKRFGITMEDKVVLTLDSAMPKTECKSRSEFITEAVLYYASALNTQDISKILSPAIESSIRGSIQDSENHIANLLYKFAVELDILTHVTAAANDIDESILKKLRGTCIQEVNRSTNRVSFENAYKIQKG